VRACEGRLVQLPRICHVQVFGNVRVVSAVQYRLRENCVRGEAASLVQNANAVEEAELLGLLTRGSTE
jgi:hypothetical protein